MTPEERLVEIANGYDPDGELAASVLRQLAWRLRHSGKDCANCGRALAMTEFGRDVRKRDGLEDRCKACEAARRRRIRALSR
ncbi:hypothetical protein N1027_10700 [Herbiconiux sp. CPCC 205763]|uniref:HNH endonuclease n=1 Tax=Herbiconiux aconitum TaxID=2970913 RepID=A0ABT2GQV5_9MICO|nr:hypothetical protein [Herbiconiux aconitum]MCS5718602.1 hypothetical protein [Herbiconiux aconitum]